MEHNPHTLLERLRQASEASISKGELSIAAAGKLMEHLEQSLQQSTYLEADHHGEPNNSMPPQK
jgi:arginine decarboxylase